MKPVFVVALVVLAALCGLVTASASDSTWHPTPEAFAAFMGGDLRGEGIVELRQRLIVRVQEWARGKIKAHEEAPPEERGPHELRSKEYPYFGFVPEYLATAVPNGAQVAWSGLCFRDSKAAVTRSAEGVYTVTFTLGDPASTWCSDNYLFATVSGAQTKNFLFRGVHNVTWTLPANASKSERWDLDTKGVRIFQFLDNPLQTAGDLLDTVLLFASELSKDVPEWIAKINLDFMSKYAGIKMTTRKTQSVALNESYINSGDFFGVIRLDGVDPMLAWAMGSTTGHTTMALRDPIDGVLYVCESTTNSTYWPTNGIQKTPYATWVLQARAAGYAVVHAPLSAAARATFNETAAWDFFNSVQGLDYGYRNLLYGWIDTLEDNFPCLPPDYNVCLRWEHVEILFAMVNRLAPSVSDMLWGQAFNIRLGQENMTMADLYYHAAQSNVSIASVPSMVESDDFDYYTTRNGVPVKGKSMVCCVFVCNMWKHSGVFDAIGRDSVNCAELTNWDDYALDLFDTTTPRPAECIAADPDNALCQIEGTYTLQLNDYASKKPYSHMAERCPSRPPYYKKPADC